MRNIIVINDGSFAAEHAAILALNIANKVNADLMIANLVKLKIRVTSNDQVLTNNTIENDVQSSKNLLDKLISINKTNQSVTKIKNIDASDFDEKHLIDLVFKHEIWMMVKGVADINTNNTSQLNIDINAVLNRARCPLLLIPENFQIKEIEQIAYMADLRYCRLPIVSYLAELSRPYKANLMIAHLSANGLPDMEDNYARTVFNDGISNNIKYERLYFNNIKERDLNKAVDVMIEGMHTDMLVLVNHRYHLTEIIGDYITNTLPDHISIPLLIFPL